MSFNNLFIPIYMSMARTSVHFIDSLYVFNEIKIFKIPNEKVGPHTFRSHRVYNHAPMLIVIYII